MTFVAGSLAGKPVRRVEDADLLRGLATYVDNLKIDDMLSLAFVRSPSAHAEIRSIDISEAERMPGVVAVYTAENLELPDFVGFFQVHPGVHRQPLASGRVRFVGDPVAVVVAESKSQAVDAAELVAVEYETLAAAIDMEAALAPGAPQQYEEVPGNLLSGTRDPGPSTRSAAPTSSSGGASRTSAWPLCRWKGPLSPSCPAAKARSSSSPPTSRARCRT